MVKYEPGAWVTVLILVVFRNQKLIISAKKLRNCKLQPVVHLFFKNIFKNEASDIYELLQKVLRKKKNDVIILKQIIWIILKVK